ncbi:hypothetical protein Pmar_PMAR012402 [Perkinsus marinus ATCC 50983]|uniref:Uncharacterized protein n=1 Tax=Perkinsus marinus (strain ATCC 50983 / TXsc) TaxID=423536 RepID=C5K788_PERM5|nr:hypothetical protein Pmar_PMAR012402 [Perkinsus marinus ATCC 50983]EER19423.1 hypothetical protein Pmar_PMAR012402 [Perkinsus marinus ATCC 50983]|eukprot:XP_002787627.1 hypothetical protein Pmar_PMAR012402 [Perkinsus marinus ATCC 50983]
MIGVKLTYGPLLPRRPKFLSPFSQISSPSQADQHLAPKKPLPGTQAVLGTR